PFDTWVPELELGFPQFLYYQHLPHLAVVALHRALLGSVDLVTLFNALRYLLLVTFPLTVLWSLRRMGLPTVAACVAAGAAPTVSASHRYGLEYDSYVWRGFGMYTQLWAMHLTFVAIASFHSLLVRGRGHALAIVALSVLALSHLLYAYIAAVTFGVIFVATLPRRDRTTLLARARSVALVAAAVAVITSYMWVPFLLVPGYINEGRGSP